MNEYHVTGSMQVLHHIDTYVIARDPVHAREIIMRSLTLDRAVMESNLHFEDTNAESS